MGERDSDTEEVIESRQISRCGRTCIHFPFFKWLSFFVINLCRLIGLTLFLTWSVDCFVREYHTFANCKNFQLFSSPKIFECFWLFNTCSASLFLIYHVIYHCPTFCGMRTMAGHLVKKKYFYQTIFTLIVIIAYVLYVMQKEFETWSSLVYILFIIEKILIVTLMFMLNFLPRFLRENSRYKRVVYKAALVIYVVENSLVALLGSIYAAYKVITAPNEDDKTSSKPSLEAVVDLVVLVTQCGFRYFLADFFLSKLFDHDLDILGGDANLEGYSEPRADEVDEHPESQRMVSTPTTDLED